MDISQYDYYWYMFICTMASVRILQKRFCKKTIKSGKQKKNRKDLRKVDKRRY